MTHLTVLGNDASGLSLWFRLGEHETDATAPELAHARQQAAKYGRCYVGHIRLDESQITELIAAMERPQFLYPDQTCKWCETGAVVVIEGEPFCHGHAAALDAREEEGLLR